MGQLVCRYVKADARARELEADVAALDQSHAEELTTRARWGAVQVKKSIFTHSLESAV
jgi:hypothetical protein